MLPLLLFICCCPHCAAALCWFVAFSACIGLAALVLGGVVWAVWLALAYVWSVAWAVWLALAYVWFALFQWVLLAGGLLTVALTSMMYYDARSMIAD